MNIFGSTRYHDGIIAVCKLLADALRVYLSYDTVSIVARPFGVTSTHLHEQSGARVQRYGWHRNRSYSGRRSIVPRNLHGRAPASQRSYRSEQAVPRARPRRRKVNARVSGELATVCTPDPA